MRPDEVIRRIPAPLRRIMGIGGSAGFTGGGGVQSFGNQGTGNQPRLIFTSKGYVGRPYSTTGAGQYSDAGNSSPGAGSGTVDLYLPEEFSVGYSAGYEEFAMGALISSLMNGGEDAMSAIGSALRDNAAGMAGMENLNASQYQSQGKAKNPNMEVLFKNMNFRTFTFNFKFHPNNPSEAQEVKNIVKIFKLGMHPEMDGVYLKYPDTWQIEYQGQGDFYNKFATCVLTDMTYNYSGTGVTAQFEDGAPVESSLSLTFKEIEFLTKSSVNDGY
jgi:hypothetical protein